MLQSWIARYLHCAPSTISNELKRGTPPRTGSRGRAPGYSAKRGDAVYKENRKNSHKPHRIDKCTSFVQWVVTQVRTEKWSIDACVGYARKNKLFPEDEMVCTKTLYNTEQRSTLRIPTLPGNAHKMSVTMGYCGDISPKEYPLRISPRRISSGQQMPSTAFRGRIWGTVPQKNSLKHSLTLFPQPERLRKPQFWLNLTLQPKL